MTVQRTRVGHVDQASQITVEPVGSVTKTNVQTALEQLTGLVTPNDSEFIVGTADAALPNAFVLTDTATVTWDLTTPGEAKANAAASINAFSTIAVSGQSDVVADLSADTLTLVAGSNITITTDASTDTVTIAAAGSSTDSFKTIAVSGQSDVVADSSTDTLTLVAGSNITITTNAGTDTITIAASGGGGLSDADYGDITVSGSGTVMTVDPGAITYAKLQDASAGNVVLARAAATSGDYSEVALSASQLLGRGASGDVAAITLGTNLSMSGTTLNASGGGGGLTRGEALAMSNRMDGM